HRAHRGDALGHARGGGRIGLRRQRLVQEEGSDDQPERDQDEESDHQGEALEEVEVVVAHGAPWPAWPPATAAPDYRAGAARATRSRRAWRGGPGRCVPARAGPRWEDAALAPPPLPCPPLPGPGPVPAPPPGPAPPPPPPPPARPPAPARRDPDALPSADGSGAVPGAAPRPRRPPSRHAACRPAVPAARPSPAWPRRGAFARQWPTSLSTNCRLRPSCCSCSPSTAAPS